MRGRHPKLLKFTAPSPPATESATHNCAIYGMRETREWPYLVEWSSRVICFAEALIDDHALRDRVTVMSSDRDVRHGVCCEA